MKSKSWKDIAELIGTAAIVASLIAVALELRQTQFSLDAATYQARAFDSIAMHQYVGESEYLLPVLISTNYGKDTHSVSELSNLDRARLERYFRMVMNDLDNEHYQYENGFLNADFFEKATIPAIKNFAPRWRAMGLSEPRRSFEEVVDVALEE